MRPRLTLSGRRLVVSAVAFALLVFGFCLGKWFSRSDSVGKYPEELVYAQASDDIVNGGAFFIPTSARRPLAWSRMAAATIYCAFPIGSSRLSLVLPLFWMMPIHRQNMETSSGRKHSNRQSLVSVVHCLLFLVHVNRKSVRRLIWN